MRYSITQPDYVEEYYVDLLFPFGCHSSLVLFSGYANVLQYGMHISHILDQLHYLDDYLLAPVSITHPSASVMLMWWSRPMNTSSSLSTLRRFLIQSQLMPSLAWTSPLLSRNPHWPRTLSGYCHIALRSSPDMLYHQVGHTLTHGQVLLYVVILLIQLGILHPHDQPIQEGSKTSPLDKAQGWVSPQYHLVFHLPTHLKWGQPSVQHPLVDLFCLSMQVASVSAVICRNTGNEASSPSWPSKTRACQLTG